MRLGRSSEGGRLLATLVLVVSWLSPSSPAESSCQTSFCYYQRDQLGRQRETELKQKISEDPSNRDHWQGLLRLLEGKYGRERSLSAFHARLHWEPQPILERPEAYRAEYETETAEWRAAYREAFLEAQSPVCQRARHIEDPEERVQWLRSELEEALEPPDFPRCLTEALVELNRADEAVDLLTRLRDEYPEDPWTHDELTSLLSRLEAEDSLLHALELQAAQFPDDFDIQNTLLSAYHQQDLTGRREAFFEELWQRFPSAEQRRALCWAADPDHEATCLMRLLQEHESESKDEVLDRARSSVWSYYHDRQDWAAIQKLAGQTPSTEQLLQLWSDIVEWQENEEACSQLRTFHEARGFDRVLAEAPEKPGTVLSMVRLLHTCDRQALGETLLRTWLPYFPANLLRWSEDYRDTFRREIQRRLAQDPANRELLQALLRTDPDPQDRIVTRSRLAALPPDDPRDVKPLLALAHELRAQDRLKEAAGVMAQAAERRPEDTDLLIRTGLAALEAKDHEEVRRLARRVLRQKNATMRHRAEAGYLMGRVDFREGRLDDAIHRFDHYFSLRLRFGGCPDWITCDLAFQLLLAHVGDVDRLRDYQARRTKGIEAFRDQIEDRFFPGKEPSYDMLVICPEVPCQRWSLHQIEEHFAARDLGLLALPHQLQRTDW